jgi:hypothetical protein
VWKSWRSGGRVGVEVVEVVEPQRSGDLEVWRLCRYGGDVWRSGERVGLEVWRSGGRVGMEVWRA